MSDAAYWRGIFAKRGVRQNDVISDPFCWSMLHQAAVKSDPTLTGRKWVFEDGSSLMANAAGLMICEVRKSNA